MDQEEPLSEGSEFRIFPFFVLHKWEPRRGGYAWVDFLGIPSLATQRKYFGCRAETRLVSTKGNRFRQSAAYNKQHGILRTSLERQPGGFLLAQE
ncbi:hypothetical protein ACO0LG_06750 [Undibacterium sp. Ji42W]|uniref:hypothetical protein n=1 Tax=Undibacterium sp. Ji42W TaxID=3413039 RepID=UPI003BF24C2C